MTDGLGLGTDGLGELFVGFADGECAGVLGVGVADVGAGVGRGGSGMLEVGDGEVEVPPVGAESDGDGFDVTLLEGLDVALGAPDEGEGLTSARAGRASARQIPAVSAATAPRRTTGNVTRQFLPIKASPGRTAG